MKEIIKPERGSLDKIAKACGCKKSTVSMILNGSDSFSPELIKKVKHVALTQYKGKRFEKPELKEIK